MIFSSSSQSSTGGDHALGMLDLAESTKIGHKNGEKETQTVRTEPSAPESPACLEGHQLNLSEN